MDYDAFATEQGRIGKLIVTAIDSAAAAGNEFYTDSRATLGRYSDPINCNTMPSIGGIPTEPIHGATHDEMYTSRPPYDGWASYGHYKAGFLPDPGGYLDQPELWLEVIEACGVIDASMQRYTLKKRAEKANRK